MAKLRSGWAWVNLGDIAEIKSGLTKGKKRRAEDRLISVPYLRVANVQRGHLDLADVTEILATREEIEHLRLVKDDILFNEGGDRDKLGRGWIWSDEIGTCIHQNHVFRARLRCSEISPRYISHYGNSSAAQGYFLRSGKQTTNLASINRTKLSELPIPLPPAVEQGRIVAKLEALQQRTRRARTALDAIPPLLEKFRQSVLAAAFRGDLTADWRAQNPDVEPASVLLERIREERRRRWEEAELAKMKAKGKVPSDDRWKAKYRPAEHVNEKDDQVLPSGWCWVYMEELARVATGATPNRSEKRYWYGGTIPWVTSGALNKPFIDQPSELITSEALAETNTQLFPIGTLLLAMYGEGQTRGRSSELRIESTTNQAVAALTLEGLSLLCKPWVKLFLLRNYSDVRLAASGGVQPNLNLGIVKNLKIPLPPLAEQQAILANYDARISRTGAASRLLSDMPDALTGLERAVLAKAFRGELVPQDPNDEPAAKLLERIRAAKPEKPTRRGRRRAKDPKPEPSDVNRADEPEPAESLPVIPKARDYTLDDWRRALLSCLGDEPAEREDAIEAAAIWAAENMGLEFERLPRNGVIVRGLKSALRSAIRRGEVERLGTSTVRRSAPSPG